MEKSWRRWAMALLSLAIIGGAVWFGFSTWQRLWSPPPPATTSINSKPSQFEEAVASVSTSPPLSNVESASGGMLVEPKDSTTFLREAKSGTFTVIVLNSGNNVASGYNENAVPKALVVSQLLPEQADLLTSEEEKIEARIEIVDPVRAWNASVAVTPKEPVADYSMWYVTAIGVSIFLAIMLFAYLWRRKNRTSRRAFGVQANVSDANKGRNLDDAFVPHTRFADVAGCDEAVEDLREIVDYLKSPEKYKRVKAEVPRGALLIGPPGTGKTLLARAVAGEAGVPFYPVSGSDFIEMYVGVGSSRVRRLFAKARKHKEGAIVFIDEIDAVGRKRGSSINSHHEQESTLNALLVEMDGFHQDKVVVLGASNRADMLDPALRRPGRLERQVQVPLPDRQGRERILRVHAEEKPLEEEVDLEHIARRTSGMSGAELARVVNEACLAAARKQKGSVGRKEFEEAIETVALGKARVSAVVTDKDRLITAWHEAGHTVAALRVPHASPPISVSIIPRGPAGGVTWMHQGDDMFLTRSQAHAQLTVAMAGRAAEEILLEGEFTSGPHGDLAAATSLARNMVTKFGMTDAGLTVHAEESLVTGGALAAQIASTVESLLQSALDEARTTLSSNRTLLEAVVDALLDNDSLSAVELRELVESTGTKTNL